MRSELGATNELTAPPDRPHRLQLYVSIKVGGVLYKSLTLKRLPDIVAYLNDRGSSLDVAIAGLALSARVPQDVIERLGPRDFTAACMHMVSLHPEIETNG